MVMIIMGVPLSLNPNIRRVLVLSGHADKERKACNDTAGSGQRSTDLLRGLNNSSLKQAQQ